MFGVTLVLAGLIRPLVRRGSKGLAQVAFAARLAVMLLFVLSGAWFAIAPRADQPLIDSLEYAVPGVVSLYMSTLELEIIRDTGRYADRYRVDAERLNDSEARSRWQGAALTDLEVRRISSLLQSYTEMRKGEEFAQREVRGRARERARWIVGAMLIVCGLLLLPTRLRFGVRGPRYRDRD